MLVREYVAAGRTSRLTLLRGRAGWDVREERDNEIVRRASYTDWHRVERAIFTFERSCREEQEG